MREYSREPSALLLSLASLSRELALRNRKVRMMAEMSEACLFEKIDELEECDVYYSLYWKWVFENSS